MTKHSTRTNPLARLVGRLVRPAMPARPTAPAPEEEELEPTVKMYPRPFIRYGD